MKIGILGGSFNPIHNGHLHIAESVYKELKLDKILFIPANISPGKEILYHISKQERYMMVETIISKYSYFEVSDIEIKREGISYTIDTLK